MRRFTIAGLMAAVLLVGIGTAALRFASEAWAGLVLLLLVGSLLVAALGVLYRRGAARAGWLGSLLFSGAYTTLAFGPWFAVEVLPRLPTTPLLDSLHSRLHPPQAVRQVFWTTTPAASGTQVRGRTSLALAGDVRLWQATTTLNGFTLIASDGRIEHFQRVGHGLFAILSGLVGALVARRFQRTAPG